MPPTVEDRLRDILEAITEIEGIVAGSNFVRTDLPALKNFVSRKITQA
jgi:hypothetical protein